jgi:hypothetical protein
VKGALLRRLILHLLYACLFGAALGGMAYLGGHTANHNGARTLGEAGSIGLFFAIAYLVFSVLNACLRTGGTRPRRRRSAR